MSIVEFLETFKNQIYAIIWGISFILLGVFMWHDAFPIALGTAFLLLGLGIILSEVHSQAEESKDKEG